MDYLVKPWDHQVEAIRRASVLPDYALFMEPGTGKTATAINICRQKMNECRESLKVLVVAPLITLENWKREWGVHSKIEQKKVLVAHGKLSRVRSSAEFAPYQVIITNYETLLKSDFIRYIEIWGPQILIYDESHKLKNHQAKRTKIATKLSEYHSIRHRLILTGTPVLNTPLDLFTQYQAMDCGRTFGKNFWAFRARFFRDRNAGMAKQKYFPDWVPLPDTAEQLNSMISASSFHVKKEECLTLPPLVCTTVEVDISTAQRRAYDEMKQHLISYVNDKACVATLALTKALRLQQIVSGHVPVGEGEDKEVIEFKDNPKADALSEILEDITPAHKVLVWCVFRHDYKVLRKVCNDLGIKFVEVTGEMTSEERFESVRAFNDDASIRVLFGNPSSGGIGINLVAASYAVFYSRNFSLESDIQAMARCYRGGSERHVKITRIDIVAKNTIDAEVSKALASKEEIGEKILAKIAELG